MCLVAKAYFGIMWERIHRTSIRRYQTEHPKRHSSPMGSLLRVVPVSDPFFFVRIRYKFYRPNPGINGNDIPPLLWAMCVKQTTKNANLTQEPGEFTINRGSPQSLSPLTKFS